MKCPHCNHLSNTALFKCSQCGESYDTATLEQFHSLQYLLAWLDERERAAELKPEVYAMLRGTAFKQLEQLRAGLKLAPVAPLAAPAVAPLAPATPPIPSSPLLAPEPIARALALVTATRQRISGWAAAADLSAVSASAVRNYLDRRIAELKTDLAGRTVTVGLTNDEQIIQFVVESSNLWVEKGIITTAEAKALRDHLLVPQSVPQPEPQAAPMPPPPVTIPEPKPQSQIQATLQKVATPVQPLAAPTPMAVSQPVVAVAAKPMAPAVAKPSVPAKPPIDWNKVWEKAWGLVLSGALLQGLLYLGAFMIVVSAIVLVAWFWSKIPLLAQLGFITAIPLSFYVSGFVMRGRLKLPEAGGVFTGIGAILVAVDFAAVYQIGGLRASVDVNVYWLIASSVCSAIFIFTAWRVRGEFFAYLVLIGLTSILLALTAALRLPLEWWWAVSTGSGAVMMGVAGWLKTRSLTQPKPNPSFDDLAVATRRLPHVLVPISLFLVLLVPGPAAFGQMVAFIFAALGYGLLAEFFPAVFFAHAATWTSVGAIGFAMRGLGLEAKWYAAAAALVAPLYILLSRWFRQQTIDFIPPRRSYQGAAHSAGFALLAAAVITGLVTVVVDVWAGVTALTLASVVLAWCAYFLRRPALVFLASGLFIAPFSIATLRLLNDNNVSQLIAWRAAAWSGLALVYLISAGGLRRAEKYVTWLHLWAQALVPLAGLGLVINYWVTAQAWFNGPTLVALAGVIAVYGASAFLHDSGRHPALSRYVPKANQSIFLWPIAALIPVWAAIAWWGTVYDYRWVSVIWAALALAYVGAGQWLAKRKAAYRFPPQVLAYGLPVIGVWLALNDPLILMTTLYLSVATLALLAVVYRRDLETLIASALFLWPFYLSLQLLNILPQAFSLAYALLAALGYIPLGILLDKFGRKFSLPLYVVGYGVAALSVAASLGGRLGLYPDNVEWVGVAAPLVVTGLLILSLYHFKQAAFAWVAAAVAPIAFGQTLGLLKLDPAYAAAAWVGLAFVYLFLERGLVVTVTVGSFLDQARERSQAFRWPLGFGVIALSSLGLVLTLPDTVLAWTGFFINNYAALVLAQGLVLALVIVAARLYRSRWPLFLAAPLAFAAVTTFFVGFGPLILGRALTASQYSLVWSVLGLLHLSLAAWLDRAKIRYSHGLYMGGYALSVFAVVWSSLSQEILLWTLGLGLVGALGSALLVHFNRHYTWAEVVESVFGPKVTVRRSLVRDAFIWVAAWAFPVWGVLLLLQLNVVDGFYWLGLGGSALALLALAVWLKRVERSYAWPLHTAAQFYTALGLIISAPTTLALLGRVANPFYFQSALSFIVIQTLAVAFYALSAWAFQRRFFAHVAAWLAFFPYTLAWVRFSELSPVQFALPWVALAVVALVTGFGLDRLRGRYAHGPYLFGYALAVFALGWSTSNRLINIYTLGSLILVALASQVFAQRGWHLSFNNFLNFFWRKPDTVARKVAQTIFLFFAAYAFPVWLALVMAHNAVPLAWQGLGLALAAPIYIAFGLAVRRVRTEYAWPLYTAGYALTAIGAMISFENKTLAIYVLALDAVVYAASAYIFRQSAWLYLSNTLLPIIVLLILNHNDSLSAAWVAGLFMALALAYFLSGQAFDWRTRLTKLDSGVNLYALAFYAPAYVLSAVAMAVSISGTTWLGISIFSAAVLLYALSAWRFREPIFLYPAVWFSAVPYYLLLTTTVLPRDWYGVAWLPLIVISLTLGKFVFHRLPLRGFSAMLRTIWRDDESASVQPLAHPALPFYLLTYALSVLMLASSRSMALTFTVALVAAALLYFASAALFRRAAWLYPALLVTHLGLLSFLAINPSDQPAQYIALPFLVLTWWVALVGLFFSRRFPLAPRPESAKLGILRFGFLKFGFLKFGFWKFLLTPSWSQPFLIFATLDVFFWQFVALGNVNTAIIVAGGFMLLLMLLATLWQDAALAYGTLIFFMIATGYRLNSAGLSLPDSFAILGGIGFGLYLLARIAARASPSGEAASPDGETAPLGLTIWPQPLTHASIVLTALATLVTLPFVLSRTFATAAALAFAGTLYLTLAYRGGYYRLGYTAMAMLILAWTLVLAFGQKIVEPQLYSIPAGLYFGGVGYLERRRSRRLFAMLIETFGLAVLLLTPFIQSLNGSQGGLIYFLILLVASLAVIWWGASRRLKVPFFIGLGASVLNVAGQIVVLFGGGELLLRFIIIGAVGLVIVTAAVLVERQRTRLITKSQEWLKALETWE